MGVRPASPPESRRVGGAGRRGQRSVAMGAAGTQAPTGQLHHRVALAYLVHIRTDEGKVQERAQHGYSSDKTDGNWEEAPEQEEEAVNLQDNSNNGPAYEDHTHTPEEETSGLHLVLLKEEAKRPFQPDDKGQPSNEEYISNSQECFVKKQDHSKEEEKYAETC